jgi:hypothetical protein
MPLSDDQLKFIVHRGSHLEMPAKQPCFGKRILH